MKEAVRKARQLMIQKKIINPIQKQDPRAKIAHSVDSRETSALELKEFLEIESNIRGYSNGPKFSNMSHGKKVFQNEIMKSLANEIPNHAYSRRMGREGNSTEHPAKSLYSSQEFKHFSKDQKRIFAESTNISKSALIGNDIEASGILSKVNLHTSGPNYKYLSMQKKCLQAKVAPPSPLIAHRKQKTTVQKNQEITNEQTNSPKRGQMRKGEPQSAKSLNHQ